MKIRSTVMTAIAVLGFSAGVATVHADEVNGFVTTNVSYADLNIDSDAGAKRFYIRVQSAAKSVCSQFDERELMVASRFKGCFDNAVASAVAQANNSKVTALYSHSRASSQRLVASR